MRSFFCIFLLMVATSIEARMYQWVNPTTGSSQMSGKAPAWYRSETGGPRVLVFDKNKLVDDTAVGVDENQRVRLRGLAFHSETSDEGKTFTAAQAISTLEEKIQAIVESPAMEAYLKNPSSLAKLESPQVKNNNSSKETADQVKNKANQPVRESTDERVERLKALISVWDENRTKEAKSILEPNASIQEEPKRHTPDSVVKEFGFKDLEEFKEMWDNL